MDEDDIILCRFGTPLDPIEEDEVPQKKPIAIEDQIVTDENGKRRFHGAFTGGFSAGFWNTVGSLEGWKPQEFKSSRTMKAELKQQRPVDFMDDEDMGEFGIAPQRIQTTKDFTQEDRKRKFQRKQTGPIPGIPVLHQLLGPPSDGVAIRLLKKMGWKPGQGIGSRQTRKEKRAAAKVNKREKYVIEKYGCDLGPLNSISNDQNQEESDLSDDNEITFAPDDFESFVCVIKDNKFGLGYSGLSKNPVLNSQQTSLFGGTLVLIGKDNKKLSISGQAFGVGALEEDDEDIYQKDDLTKYDFSLDNAKKIKYTQKKKTNDISSIEGFHECNSTLSKKQFIIAMTSSFTPRNWLMRKTRFEPLNEKVAKDIDKQNEFKLRGIGRHDLKPQERHSILEQPLSSDQERKSNSGEPSTSCINSKEQMDSEQKNTLALEKLNRLRSKCDKFIKDENSQEDSNIKEIEPIIIKESKKENDEVKSEKEHNEVNSKSGKITSSIDTFKPFLGNPEKQTRYEKFLEKGFTIDIEITKFLKTVQPLSMSEWDREMEKKEFVQAQKIYTPLRGFMADRFVSEKAVQVPNCSLDTKPDDELKLKTKRTKTMWKPCSQLCKRFNIAEPFGGSMAIEEKKIKKPKVSIFNYLETSINRKESFITPIIIPKKIPETAQSILNIQTSTLTSNKNLPESNSETEVVVAERTQNQNQDQKICTTKQPREKPKSKLETKIEESKNKHPSEKTDLFKAIFDSSSEDENDEKMESKPQHNSNNILAVLNKNAAEINILKNNSPPRGIFAAYFKNSSMSEPEVKIMNNESSSSDKISNLVEINKNKTPTETSSLMNKNKIVFKSKKHRNNEEIESSSSNVYGPALPHHLSSVKSDNKEKRLTELFHKHKKSMDSWVEKKSSIKNDKSSKKKKKNKDKDKEKRREHKHKKHKKNKK